VAKIICVASAVPNIGEPLRIETAPQNEPMMTGAPGRTSCASAIPAIVGDASRHGHRTHRAGEHRRHDDASLVARGERAQRAEHPPVESQRRVGVDVAEQHRMRLEMPLAEQDVGHGDRVGGVSRGLGGALAGLVAPAERGVLDVEVPLVGRQVHRLAGADAREMQGGRHLRQLHEVDDVLDGAVATATVEVRDEGRPGHRAEGGGIAADEQVAARVARMQRELRRRRLQQLAAHPLGHAHPLAVDVRAGRAPQPQGLGVAAELDADLLQDLLRGRFDELDRFLSEQVKRRQAAADLPELPGAEPRTRRPARRARPARDLDAFGHVTLRAPQSATNLSLHQVCCIAARVARNSVASILDGGSTSLAVSRQPRY
jgi:hypothetical protein